MKKTFNLLLFQLFFCVTSFCTVTTKDVTGTVTDEKGSPVTGVSVLITGTTIRTTTDADGEYEIEGVPEFGSLIFTAVGFAVREEKIYNRDEISIVLLRLANAPVGATTPAASSTTVVISPSPVSANNQVAATVATSKLVARLNAVLEFEPQIVKAAGAFAEVQQKLREKKLMKVAAKKAFAAVPAPTVAAPVPLREHTAETLPEDVANAKPY